jgi:hypothetical protein
MQNYGIKPGVYEKLYNGKSFPNFLDLKKFVSDVLNEEGYPVFTDCCIDAPKSSDIGKVLTIGANGIVATTVAGVGGSVNGVSLGTLTSTGIQIVVTGGTNFNLPLATNSTAGLISGTLQQFLNTLASSGLSSTESITGNGLSATPFKLLNDVLSPGNNYYYGTNGSGVKGFYNLPTGGGTLVQYQSAGTNLGTAGTVDTINFTGSAVTATRTGNTMTVNVVGGGSGITLADVSTSFKFMQLVPTAINTIPNLLPLPLNNNEVAITVNGVKVDNSGITVSAAGVFTVNPAILGYSVDTGDVIDCIYFS